MANDPIRNFYELGFADAKAGRKIKRPVCQNYKLAYVNGWYDARKGAPSRYAVLANAR